MGFSAKYLYFKNMYRKTSDEKYSLFTHVRVSKNMFVLAQSTILQACTESLPKAIMANKLRN